jgi:hypothetical protein
MGIMSKKERIDQLEQRLAELCEYVEALEARIEEAEGRLALNQWNPSTPVPFNPGGIPWTPYPNVTWSTGNLSDYRVRLHSPTIIWQ